MPAIAVAADQQLMPGPPPCVTLHLALELLTGGLGDNRTVRLRARRVPQRLVNEIAAIADEVPEQRDLAFRPGLDERRLRELPGERETISDRQPAHRRPTTACEKSVLRRRTYRPSAGRADRQDGSAAHAPDAFALGGADLP